MRSASCDLILLTCGNPIVKSCAESLLATMQTPCRLIVVDNDSGEEIKAYLRSLKGNDLVTVEVITNEKNEGFVLGMNRGMRRSTAPYVALLNDDLIFTKDWLPRILEVGQRHPQIGILNPSSNTFGDHPPKGWTLEQYAEERKRRFSGQVTRMATASGFCMVMKQELIQKIGYLDEVFVPIFFEDTDYSCRAAAAGYHSVMVKDAYVYHHEHRSFFRIRRQPEVYRRNEAIFNKRWGRSLRILAPLRFCPESDPQAFKEQLDILSDWSLQRCFLYAPLGIAPALSFSKFQETFLSEERSRVRFFPFSLSFSFNLFCIYHLLRRRKKPFDCLFFFDSDSIDPLLRKVGTFFRLPIFFVEKQALMVLENGRARGIGPFRTSGVPASMRETIQ